MEMEISQVFKHTIRVACHVGALWMCLTLFLRYLENEDASKVHYTKFHTTPIDLYPTLTLCINAKSGGLLDEKKFHSGADPFQYFMGHEYNSNHDYNSINFEDIMPRMSQLLKKFYAKNSHATKIDPWYHPVLYPKGYNSFPKFRDEDLKFYTSYLDPTTICYSWEVEYSKKEILSNVDFYIQLELLKNITEGKLLSNT